jgi:hypothetical protein
VHLKMILDLKTYRDLNNSVHLKMLLDLNN